MSFEEDRRNNGNRASNLTVRYIDTREREVEREVERERYERVRGERDDRHKRCKTCHFCFHLNLNFLDIIMNLTERGTEVRETFLTARGLTMKTPNGK